MWSIGAAVLLGIVVCAGAIALAARRLLGELEPTRQSMDRLGVELEASLQLVTRDTGRAAAGTRVLLRRDNPSRENPRPGIEPAPR